MNTCILINQTFGKKAFMKYSMCYDDIWLH